ncbi:MAG TPA: hypothetical protein VN810_05470, partial [Terriglobales bacterium]|nr:hypothetical protein [Terriglobales bacterium]
LYASILSNPKIASQPINSIGAIAMILVAILLFIAAAVIAYDAWRAWRRIGGERRAVQPAMAHD